MPGPTFRAVTTFASSGVVSSFNIAYDASIQAGDQLLLFVSNTSGATANTPTGWTLIRDTLATGGSFPVRCCFYTRTAQAGDAGTNLNVSGLSCAVDATMLSYSGGTYNTFADTAGSSSSTTITAPSVTTPVNNCIVVECFAGQSDAVSTNVITNPATNRSRLAATNEYIGQSTSEQAQAVAGASGTQTATATSTGAWVAQTVVIAPPVAPSFGPVDDFTSVGVTGINWTVMPLGPVRQTGNSWVTLGATSTGPSGVWPGGIQSVQLYAIPDTAYVQAKMQADNWCVLQLSAPTATGFTQSFIQMLNVGTTDTLSWGTGIQPTNQAYISSAGGSTSITGGRPIWLQISRSGTNFLFGWAPDSAGSPGSFTTIATQSIPASSATVTGAYIQLIGINGLVDAINTTGSSHSSPPVNTMIDRFNSIDWINWTGWDRGFPSDWQVNSGNLISTSDSIKSARTYKGRLRLGGPGTGTNPKWTEEIDSCHRWEMANGENIYARVWPRTNYQNSKSLTMFGVSDPVSGSAYFSMYVDTASTSASGNFFVEYNNGLGVTTDYSLGTYDPVQNAWWSLAASGYGPGLLLAQTAPDVTGTPGTWTTKFTLKPVFGPDVKPFFRSIAASGDPGVFYGAFYDGINSDAIVTTHDIALLEDDFTAGTIGPKWSYTSAGVTESGNALHLSVAASGYADAYSTNPFFMQNGSALWLRVPAMSLPASGGTYAKLFIGLGEWSRHQTPGTPEYTDTYYGYQSATPGHFPYTPTVLNPYASTGLTITVRSAAPTAQIAAGDFQDFYQGPLVEANTRHYDSSTNAADIANWGFAVADMTQDLWIAITAPTVSGHTLLIWETPNVGGWQGISPTPIPQDPSGWRLLQMVSLYDSQTYPSGTLAFPFHLNAAADVRLHISLHSDGPYSASIANLNVTNRITTLTDSFTETSINQSIWPYQTAGAYPIWYDPNNPSNVLSSVHNGWYHVNTDSNELETTSALQTYPIHSFNDGDYLQMRIWTLYRAKFDMQCFAWQYGQLAPGNGQSCSMIQEFITEQGGSWSNFGYPHQSLPFMDFVAGYTGQSPVIAPGNNTFTAPGLLGDWVRFYRKNNVMYLQIAPDLVGSPGAWQTYASYSLDDFPVLNLPVYNFSVYADTFSFSQLNYVNLPKYSDFSITDRLTIGGVNATIPIASNPATGLSLASLVDNFHGYWPQPSRQIWTNAHGGVAQAEGWLWLGGDTNNDACVSLQMSRPAYRLLDGDSFFVRVSPAVPNIPLDWFNEISSPLEGIKGQASVKLGSISSIGWEPILGGGSNGIPTGQTIVMNNEPGAATVQMSMGAVNITGGTVSSSAVNFLFDYNFLSSPVTSIPYDPVNHAWLRFRRVGTYLWIDTAPDSSGAHGTFSPQVSGYVGNWINNTDLYVEFHSTCIGESPEQFYSKFSGFNTTVSTYSPTASGTDITFFTDAFNAPTVTATRWDARYLNNTVTDGFLHMGTPVGLDTDSTLFSKFQNWVIADGSQMAIRVLVPPTNAMVASPTLNFWVATEPSWGVLQAFAHNKLTNVPVDISTFYALPSSMRNPSSATDSYTSSVPLAQLSTSVSGGNTLYAAPFLYSRTSASSAWQTGFEPATTTYDDWNQEGYLWLIWERKGDYLVMSAARETSPGTPGPHVEQFRLPMPIGALAGERVLVGFNNNFETVGDDSVLIDSFNLFGATVIAPSISTFSDTFDVLTVDPVKWDLALSSGYADNGQKLVLNGTSSYIQSFNTWGLPDGGHAYVRAWPDQTSGHSSFFGIQSSTGSYVEFRYTAGTLHFNSGSPSETSSVSYNRVTHAWWRIRRAGLQVAFDTAQSPDHPGPVTWTQQFITTLSPAYLNNADFFVYAGTA